MIPETTESALRNRLQVALMALEIAVEAAESIALESMTSPRPALNRRLRGLAAQMRLLAASVARPVEGGE